MLAPGAESSLIVGELSVYAFADVYVHSFLCHDARGTAEALRWFAARSDSAAQDAVATEVFIRAVGSRVRQSDIARVRVLVAERPDAWLPRMALMTALHRTLAAIATAGVESFRLVLVELAPSAEQ